MKFNLLESFYENFFGKNHYFYKRYICNYNILILDRFRWISCLIIFENNVSCDCTGNVS